MSRHSKAETSDSVKSVLTVGTVTNCMIYNKVSQVMRWASSASSNFPGLFCPIFWRIQPFTSPHALPTTSIFSGYYIFLYWIKDKEKWGKMIVCDIKNRNGMRDEKFDWSCTPTLIFVRWNQAGAAGSPCSQGKGLSRLRWGVVLPDLRPCHVCCPSFRQDWTLSTNGLYFLFMVHIRSPCFNHSNRSPRMFEAWTCDRLQRKPHSRS